MIVNLGSIEVDDQTCRAIRKATFGISGRATRNEVRAFALAAVAEELAMLEVLSAEDSTATADDDEEEEESPVSDQQWLNDMFLSPSQELTTMSGMVVDA